MNNPVNYINRETERDRLDIALDEAESNVWSRRSKLAFKSQDLERPKGEK